MHFYSRTHPHAALPPGSVPQCVITANGKMKLGMPLNTSSSSMQLSPDPLNPTAGPQSSHGVMVLMHPGAPNADNSPRAPLLFGLTCDVVMLCAVLYELHWRTVETEFLLCVGVIGTAVAAFGYFSCWFRRPSMLGLFALLCLVQFIGFAVPCQSLPQLVHTALQPLLVTFSLTLRRSRIPLVFNTGRQRQG